MHRVVALALPGVVLLDLAAPTHLFGHCGRDRYAFEIAGIDDAPVRTSTGLSILPDSDREAMRRADTVVVPGLAHPGGAPAADVAESLRAAHARGARIMSICTGAYVLAHAGLLNGRRATTHWAVAQDFAERFPEVEVDPDVLYVDDGDVLTSAGVASGLDLCLHVIRCDHGASVAAAYARRTVVSPHRDGGQAQFVERPLGDGSARAASLGPTRAWALAHLDERLDVCVLARHAAVSERTFARRFVEETGTTPGRWLTDQRVAAAQALLERTDLAIEEVAARCGFKSPALLRRHFARRTQTTPSAYRRTFRATPRAHR